MDSRPQEGAIAMDQIQRVVEETLAATQVTDIHTHLFAPAFGAIGLWGIDNLVTYHYLEAELFRFSSITPRDYFALNIEQKADLIWRTLFVENTPLSEAARGVIAVMNAFGLDTSSATLSDAREFFRSQEMDAHISNVFRLAGISTAVMTNDPLDEQEAPTWLRGFEGDPRFRPALRLDRILNFWDAHWELLASMGYTVERNGSGGTVGAVRRFLEDWAARMNPVYMAVALPDSFVYPGPDLRSKLLAEAVLPVCRDLGLPLSLMIGVRRQVNPAIRLAGDASGIADLRSLETLCRDFPDNRFLASILSRENQHELCVYARKFGNLMPFGCWWFLNNPSIVEEITRERLEMLGASFIPQHSDARILEQVIYKWRSTRRTIAPVVANAYRLLAQDGRPVTRAMVEHDVTRLFRKNFEQVCSAGAQPRVQG
jgi:hypothetical protein